MFILFNNPSVEVECGRRTILKGDLTGLNSVLLVLDGLPY